MPINVIGALMTDENSVTRTLRSLCQLHVIREIVVRHFTQGKFGADDVNYDDISEQVVLNGARPDFVIRSEDLTIVVEVKLHRWRHLTENQPRTYLQWLNERKTAAKYFVLLIPRNYEHRTEYREACRRFVDEYPEHGIVFIDDTDWLQLVGAIEDAGLAEAIPYAWEFCDAIRARCQPAPINFELGELIGNDMYNSEIATGLGKVLSVIDQLAHEIENEGIVVVTPNRERRWWLPEGGEYGVSLSIAEKEILWFGLWMPYWIAKGSPLAIGVNLKDDPAVIKSFRASFPEGKEYLPPNGEPFLIAPIVSDRLRGDAVQNILVWLRPYLNSVRDATKDSIHS